MRRRLRRLLQAGREENVCAGEAGTDSQVGIASDALVVRPSELTSRNVLRQEVGL
jgi:hypothetical protein